MGDEVFKVVRVMLRMRRRSGSTSPHLAARTREHPPTATLSVLLGHSLPGSAHAITVVRAVPMLSHVKTNSTCSCPLCKGACNAILRPSPIVSVLH